MLPTTSESPDLIAGKYKVTALLGRGGMGKVYKAMHTGLGREVALKVLHSELNSNPDFVKRFLREARAMGKFNHENIIRVFDMFKDRNTYCIAMELFEGKSLQQWIKEHGKPTLAQAIDFISQAARGLAYAHEHGVVHRDIKPQNIFVDIHYLTKIGDFGIAAIRDDSVLTTTGQLFGSPRYMSPEQACGKATDPRSDLYSLAMVCYELVCGKNPFDNKLAIAIVGELVYEQSELNLNFPANVPQELQNLIRVSLSKSPQNRPQTVAEFGSALELVHKQVAGSRVNYPGTAFKKSKATIAQTKLPNIERHHQSNPVKKTKRIGILTKFAIVLLAVTGMVYVWQQRELIQESIVVSSRSTPDALIADTSRQLLELSRMSTIVSLLRVDAEQANASQWAGGTFESAVTLHTKAEELISAVEIMVRQQNYKTAQHKILTANQYLQDAKVLFNKAQGEAIHHVELNTAAEKLEKLEVLAAEVRQRKALAEKKEAPVYRQAQFDDAQHKLAEAEELLRKARKTYRSDTATALELIDESSGCYLAASDLFISAANSAIKIATAAKAKKQYVLWKKAMARLGASRQNVLLADAGHYAPQSYENAVKRSEQLAVRAAAIDKSMDSGDHSVALSQMDKAIELAKLVSRDYVNMLDEAKAAKKAELEKNAKQQAQVETALAARPTPKDIDMVERLLYDFEHAYENKNLNLLKMITDMSENRLVSVQDVFARYQSIDLAINNYTVSGKQATAEIQIKRLVNLDGTPETQPPWRTSLLLINKDPNGWQRILWE